MDSDLNGASPQFTLACISTGGPVTNVTWTRDSTTVTQGTTETVLNDPVTAQYTHTLTVTGRLPGIYTCTVANNKPSSANASISIEGKLAPQNNPYCNIWFVFFCIRVHKSPCFIMHYACSLLLPITTTET